MTTTRNAVWLAHIRPESDQLEVLRVVAHLMGDWEAACDAIRYVDGDKQVIAGPVSDDAAEIIVKWLLSVGAHVMIDDGYYDDGVEVAA